MNIFVTKKKLKTQSSENGRPVLNSSVLITQTKTRTIYEL